MTDDTISRQAAIDALGEEPLVWHEDDAGEVAERNQWRRDVAAIKALPSAQPTLYGYDLKNLIIFADAVRKKEITESEIKDFVRNVRAAWNYAWEEFLRVQKEALKQTLKKPEEVEHNG